MAYTIILEDKFKYASVQINMPEDVAADVKKWQKGIADVALADDGVEDRPHVTVKYGIENPDEEKMRELLKDYGPIIMTLGKITCFPADENRDSDVLKVDIDSKDLYDLNKLICDNFKTVDTYDYHPHMTIAYVKSGHGDKFSDSSESSYFDGTVVASDIVLLSNTDGKKTEIQLR